MFTSGNKIFPLCLKVLFHSKTVSSFWVTLYMRSNEERKKICIPEFIFLVYASYDEFIYIYLWSFKVPKHCILLKFEYFICAKFLRPRVYSWYS